MLIFLLILSILVVLGIFFSDKVLKIETRTIQDVLDVATEKKEFKQADYDKYIKEDILVESQYGYKIAGERILSGMDKSDKVMLFSHGVATNRKSSIKYGMFFLQLGWDVVIFDHRRHGDTLDGKFSGYGYYEKNDLNSVFNYIKRIYGASCRVGIHGESMGSAIAIQQAGEYNNADFYIFDCPFSNLGKQLRYRLRVEYQLLGFIIIPLTNLFVKLRAGFSFKDVSPINFVDKIERPALFIHSRKDTYIKYNMCEELYHKKKGVKDLYIAEYGDHAESYTQNRDEYIKVVTSFLDQA
ncbi:alpha/beta hydrolase [Thiospirochaeta perfilievii]|uniref:Alpha/beta hydrolase n=1 Tax=Thiospirochaeta perfilievii TaxID=252967 RepID=A0A5C1QCT1_9SPIO|nr:alpha/beta hydrolase [Thiospirochaeta perfilievii]QEN05361.1 alpha/beta hydrolase [Thiospirochaeta perfilievii]